MISYSFNNGPSRTAAFPMYNPTKVQDVGSNVYAMAPRTPSQILVVGIKIASLLYIYKCLHSMSAIADDDLLQRYWPTVSTCVAHFRQRLCDGVHEYRWQTCTTAFRCRSICRLAFFNPDLPDSSIVPQHFRRNLAANFYAKPSFRS